MHTDISVIDIIKKRRSTRNFDKKDIDKQRLQRLEEFIEEINRQAKIRARFTLTTNNREDGKAKRLGTYGTIAGAKTYIVGILDKDEKDSVEFGCLFEKIVLFVTGLDLGTCWLGGTFSRSNFRESLALDKNEFIPIVSPVGYIKDKARLVDTVIRAGAGSGKRKAWSDLFFDSDTSKPLTKEKAGPYKTPLEMVRIGPSASNRQPWRLVKDDNKFHFLLSRTKGYGIPSYDMQKNDIGIAKCHFELTAKVLGLKGKWAKEDIGMVDGLEYICTWVGE
jgi:nitroreductase